MHGQQLDRRHAQLGQVADGRVGREPGIAATQPFGDLGMEHRKPSHVHLVDQRPVHGRAGRPVVAPSKGRIDDGGQRRKRGVIPRIERDICRRVADLVSEEGIVPTHHSADVFGIGVQEDLVRIETVPVLRFIGAVNAIAVELSGHDVRKVDMPDLLGLFGQRDPHAISLCVGPIEQAEFDLRGILRIQGEVDALAVPRRPQRIRPAGPDAPDTQRSAGPLLLGADAPLTFAKWNRPFSVRGRHGNCVLLQVLTTG